MRKLLCAAGCMGLLLAAGSPCAAPDEGLLDLDLEKLGQITLPPSATITPTTARRLPASVTVIDRQMIVDSGARSLFDLLEVYAPGLHYLYHHYETPHMGMRGIISDREDKYLIVLNGRVLNEKTHYGALSERDLPMMDDIARIDVIRGPGSVVFGPGAVSMVINIQTESVADYAGDAVTGKLGVIERFESLETKKVLHFGERHGLLLYAGVADYAGSGQSSSPLVYGNTQKTTWGGQITAGQPVTFAVPNNREAFLDQPKLKFHADYQNEDFRAWLRYTRGGEMMSWENKPITLAPYGSGKSGTPQSAYDVQGVGYQQLVLDLSQHWQIGKSNSLELKGGYSTTEYIRLQYFNLDPKRPPDNHREEEYFLRSTFRTQAGANHSLAIGGEYAYSRWGLPTGPGYPSAPPISPQLGGGTKDMGQWSTFSYGIFGEHQWQLTDTLTNFFGLRVDKDQYTRWMVSPRWALVWAPTERDTLKGVLSRSVKKNFAEELRKQDLGGQTSKPEMLSELELIYQRQLSPSLRVDLSCYVADVDIIGFNSNTLDSTPVAHYNYGGFELELGYKVDGLHLSASHSFTRLGGFRIEPGARQKISVAWMGYGNYLSNWSDNMTKLAAAWQPSDAWRLTGDLRIFWGYTGSRLTVQNTLDINAKLVPGPFSSTAVSDPGYNDSFGKAVFLDFGAQYRINPGSTLVFNAYNVLGWADKKLNKRMYIINVQDYRADAPAFGLTYRYAF